MKGMKGMKKIFMAMTILALAETTSGVVFTQGAIITGHVLDAHTSQPLRGAIVRAARVPTDKPGAASNIGFRTGEDGKFILRGVAPGAINFHVMKAGYVSGPYTSPRSAADGERIENVVLSVPPAASIAGRVVDESGQPVAGALVSTGTPMRADAKTQRTLTTLGGASVTDDDGQYWIGGLAAGDYMVAANPYGEVGVAQDPADRPGAQTITLKLEVGEERTGAGFVVKLRASNISSVSPKENQGTGVVSGRVVDTRGRGIPNSIVMLVAAAVGAAGNTLTSPNFTASTDSAGNFQIANVPAGTFGIGASAPGFPMALQLLPQPSPMPMRVVVKDGSATTGVVVTLRRGAVISGVLTDEFGDPVWASVTISGPYRTEAGAQGRTITTDARGRYRMTGLVPGEYLVSVQTPTDTEVHFESQPGHDSVLAAGRMFYPGEPRAGLASYVAVAEGEETSGIDFVLPPIAVATINVTITSDRPVNEVQLHHIVLDDRLAVQDTTIVSGSTTTLDVAPGRYRLLASADVTSEVRLWSVVDVDADPLLPASVNMNLEPGANIAGRMIFEGTTASHQGADPSLLLIQRVPGTKMLSPGNATFDAATGAFSWQGLMPGRYIIQAGNAERSTKSPWMLKAATLGGRDVLEQPIDLNPGVEIHDVVLTVTDRIGELSGRVTDADGKPASRDWVVVFSPDSKHWYPGSPRARIVRSDEKGMYVVRGLPAGSYIVALAPASAVSQSGDPSEMLQKLSTSGSSVMLREGDKKVQDLRKR